VTRARLLLPVLAAALLLVGGCGGSAAKSVAEKAQASLATVQSADLRVRLALRSQVGSQAQTGGFELRGPFSIAPGKGPLADMRYTRLGAHGPNAPIQIALDRTAGAISVGRRVVPLSAAQIAQLRALVRVEGTKNGMLSSLHVADWVRHPVVAHHGDSDTVTGELDVAAVARDLLGLARASGRSVPELSSADLKRLDSLVSSSRYELTTRKSILQRLALSFELKPAAQSERFGSLFGVGGAFELSLARVNEPVTVHVPKQA
jgi:hypothetical protein